MKVRNLSMAMDEMGNSTGVDTPRIADDSNFYIPVPGDPYYAEWLESQKALKDWNTVYDPTILKETDRIIYTMAPSGANSASKMPWLLIAAVAAIVLFK